MSEFRIVGLMKGLVTFLCTFLILGGSSLGWTKVIIVSDIDDTIKVTNVLSKGQVILNHLRGAEPFPHLIQMYKDLKGHYEKQDEEVEIVYLSASPKMVNVEKWLNANGAPEGLIKQRGLCELFTKGTYNFKFCNLKDLIRENQNNKKVGSGSDLKIFLFGDNGQQDAHVYKDILEDKDLNLKKGQVQAYIRRVSSHAEDLVHPDLHYFDSEKELMVRTELAPAINGKTVENILAAEKDDTLIPYFIQREIYLRDQQDLCKAYGVNISAEELAEGMSLISSLTRF